MGKGGRERCTKVYTFKASFLTSNISRNRNMAVIPLGCDDNMDLIVIGWERASLGAQLTTA